MSGSWLELAYQNDAHGSLADTASIKQLYTPVVVTTGGIGQGYALGDVRDLVAQLTGPVAASNNGNAGVLPAGISAVGGGGSWNPKVLLALAVGGVGLWLILKR